MLHHLYQVEELGQVSLQEFGDPYSVHKLSHTILLLPVPYHLHRHLPYVGGYQQPLHVLQRKVKTREVSC